MRFAGDGDFCLPIENEDESIERGGMLAEALSLVEGKESDGAGGVFENFAADNVAGLILNPVGGGGGLGGGKPFGLGFG